GYSLARKLFFENGRYSADTYIDELGDTIGATLLKPHVSYLNALDALLDSGIIKGLAHITGGGLLENIPRILPAGTSVEIRRGSWPVLPIFPLMQRLGNIDEPEMYRTFNMGVGMVILCDPSKTSTITNSVNASGFECFEIGRVTRGERTVVLT
ncbi:MAG TPA: AIR synthase-related protein, partial [Pyrinomonadaceae bacterium]